MGFALKFQLEMTFQIYAGGKLQSEKWVTAEAMTEYSKREKDRLSGNESREKNGLAMG